MTSRGRQYYDPEIQTTRLVPGMEELERIEVFPVGQGSTARLPQEIGKWASRRVGQDGHVIEQGPSDFEQNRTIDLASEKWPGLNTYVLNSEIEDSTWEGTGPSPRLWQQGRTEHDPIEEGFRPPDRFFTPALEPTEAETVAETPAAPAPRIHAMQVTQPGVYVKIDDVLSTLETYAQQFDNGANPSAALGIREAADALRGAF